MSDISTKSILQSQSAASSGLYQELVGKQPLQTVLQNTTSEEGIGAIETAKQQIAPSGTLGAETNSDRRDGRENENKQKSRFTVMIKSKSGEQRVVSVKADTAEAAKDAARASLEEGDQVISVDETTVPDLPDPSRGLIA